MYETHIFEQQQAQQNDTDRPAERQEAFIQQSVRLTGLNARLFRACLDTLQHLHEKLGQQVQDSAMEPLVNSILHTTIKFGNHYFTSRRDDPYSLEIPFSQAVDPKIILLSISGNLISHGPDNEVLYYQLISDGGKNPAW